MILTNSGVLKLMQRIKSFITSQLNTKAPSVHTHSISEIDDLSSLSMGGGGYTKSEVDTLLNGKSDTSHTHTKSQITDFPTIPSKTSDLTNDSGFLTSHQDLSGYVPKSGGAVMTGDLLGKTTNDSNLLFSGGTGWDYGANVSLYGKDSAYNAGVCLIRVKDNTNDNIIALYPSGQFDFGPDFHFNADVTFQVGNSAGLYTLLRYDGMIWSNSNKIFPANNLIMELGDASHKWKAINGVAVDNIGFPLTDAIDVTGNMSNYTIGGGQNVYGKYYITTVSGFVSGRFFMSPARRFRLMVYAKYDDMVNNGDPMFSLPLAETFDWESLPAPTGSCILIKPESYITPTDMGNAGWTLRIYPNKGL